MYDESWYNALAAKPQASQSSDEAHHRRREPPLRPSSESFKADDGIVQRNAERSEVLKPINEPPAATVARRARSYGDFYDIVHAHLKKEGLLEKQSQVSRSSIRTEVDFGRWYKGVSEALFDASSDEHRLYQEKIHLAQSHVDSLLESTSAALAMLSSLSDSFKAVESQTSTFRAQCEGLVAEQRRVTKLADDITENLQYYALLEPITKRLNAPGAAKLVRREEFSEMLSNLDSCLAYMHSHPNHRDSAVYRSRYRLLLTRALTLIRVHFANSLREISADVSRRIADKQLNDTTMSALLYAKFRVGSTELKQLGTEIQKRAVSSDEVDPGAEPEYQSLMNELYQSYSAARAKLILPIVRKRIGEIAMALTTSKDLVAFARSSISYGRGICFDEYDLWGDWFSGDRGLYNLLEVIMEPLYDYLRPRIIRETQILKLCELCSLIQTRYMGEDDDDSDAPDTGRLDFGELIQPALEDAQTRLVFLVLTIMRDEIEHYKPKPADLDVVPKHRSTSSPTGSTATQPTLSRKKISTNGPPTPLPSDPVLVEEDDDGEVRWNFGSEARMQSWFPTLRKAVWLLSRIYRLVNSTVFDDLAHQIVHQTTQSLHRAAHQISTRISPTDAQLFLIKHLLLLKQQIVAFDIEFVTPEVSFDFSNVTNTFWELRERGGLFNPRNLMRLVGGGLLPRVVDNMLDAKAELDGRLRAVINDFVAAFSGRMTAAVAEGVAAKKSFEPNAAARNVREAVTREVTFLRRKLEDYIEDARTRETLVGAVQDQVLLNYEGFYERHVATRGTVNGKGVSRKGKGREDAVWDPEAFAEWSEGVFNARRSELQQEEDGFSSRSLSRAGSV